MGALPMERGEDVARAGVRRRGSARRLGPGRRPGLRTAPRRLPGIVALLAVGTGCSARSAPSEPLEPASGADVYVAGWSETGVASWYGEPFHGRRTASGDVYDMEDPTAAHRTLPFGTRVYVENLDNGRSVELTVNDRGPFARGRILDVSRWGARELGMIGPGTARVRITVVRPGGGVVSRRGGCVVVQVGSYRERDTAERHRSELAASGWPARVERTGGWHRVVAGPFTSEGDARAAEASLDGFVRRCAM